MRTYYLGQKSFGSWEAGGASSKSELKKKRLKAKNAKVLQLRKRNANSSRQEGQNDNLRVDDSMLYAHDNLQLCLDESSQKKAVTSVNSRMCTIVFVYNCPR